LNKYEGLLHFHAKPLLELGEKVEAIGHLTTGLIFLKHFIGGVTDRRLVMVQIGPGLFGLNAIYEVLLDMPFKSIASLQIRGFLSSKHINIMIRSGENYRFTLNSLSRVIPGQRDFFEKLKGNYQQFRTGGKSRQ
jgi:hypothetical protein